MDDLISVIVPIYNTEKYLNECIDSIINQTYTNLELILVDDGSNDNSGQICDEYSKNNDFIKVIHQQNMGISAARNKGLENATGDWIAFVDADDWLDNNYFQVLIDETLDGTQVVCSGYKRVCGTQVESINSDGKSFYFDGVSFTEKLLNVQNGYGFAHTKLYSKDAIKDILFNTNVKVSEDALFNLDLALRNNKIKVVINSSEHDMTLANKIMRAIQSNYKDNKYITVKFQK